MHEHLVHIVRRARGGFEEPTLKPLGHCATFLHRDLAVGIVFALGAYEDEKRLWVFDFDNRLTVFLEPVESTARCDGVRENETLTFAGVVRVNGDILRGGIDTCRIHWSRREVNCSDDRVKKYQTNCNVLTATRCIEDFHQTPLVID